MLLLQGYHCQCGAAGVLLCTLDHCEGGAGDAKLSDPVLASVPHERPERNFVGCLRAGQCSAHIYFSHCMPLTGSLCNPC